MYFKSSRHKFSKNEKQNCSESRELRHILKTTQSVDTAAFLYRQILVQNLTVVVPNTWNIIKKYLEFGSYSISSWHQDGIHKTRCLQVKQPSKAPQFSITTWWQTGGKTIQFDSDHSNQSILILIVLFVWYKQITSTRRGLGQWFDHVHQLVASSDVHSAVLIGQSPVRDGSELWL